MSPPTPYYQSDKATIYHGDCLDVLPHLSGIDAVVTDPPYGVGLGINKDMRGGRLAKIPYESGDDSYESWLETVPPAILLSLKLSPVLAVFVGPHYHELPKCDCIGGVFVPNAVGRNVWGFKNFLPVLLYGSGYSVRNGNGSTHTAIKSTVLTEKNGHPCPKPIEWMEWLVLLTSGPAETILDPFMGSGTTGVACMKLGRKFIGIEIEEKYCAIAKRRIMEAEDQFALFEPPTKRVEQPELFTNDAQK